MATSLPEPPPRPHRLFISYARENEDVKDRLKINLAPLVRNGWLDVWDDRAIPAGADWRDEIEAAMKGADVALFLLGDYFLASEFCMDVEIATFLKRHHDEGVLILYVLADHCQWEEFDFISRKQLVPRTGLPIKDPGHPSPAKVYTEIAREIKNALALHQPKRLVATSSELVGRARTTDTTPALSFLMPSLDSVDRSQAGMLTEKAAGLDLLLAKLPSATTHLFGRENEIEQISEWREHKGIFLWVAAGGTGKSALVRWWLEKQAWPDGTRFLGHSFYSQGSRNQATSSRGFLIEALKQLGIPHEDNTADDELGRLLATAVVASPTVLVLDGIEPLQQVADDAKLNGMIKDRGLAALLDKLARQPGQALCLVSSRLPIPESSIADAPYFRQKDLGLLQPQGSLQLLRQRGVHGTDDELGKMAERCGQHPLSLVLAAEFSHTFLQDSAAEFLARAWQPQPGDKHAASIMALFDHELEAEHQSLDRELVRILGLFDRPAPWGAVLALKQATPIPDLTVALHDTDEASILESLARLSQWGLLSADITRNEPELDAHPLVREYFGDLLVKEQAEAWRAAHNVLFEWFCKQPAKWQPETLEEMEPLYRAIGHGCKAGRYKTALEVVYLERIQRKPAHYAFRLGSFSVDLAALAGFFPQGWDQPPIAVDDGLADESLDAEEARSYLLSTVANCLTFLGRLNDAQELWRMAREAWLVHKSWNNYCRSSESLTKLLALLGRWQESERLIRETFDTVAHSKCQLQWPSTVIILLALGRAQFGQGRLSEALSSFKKLEAVVAQNENNALKLSGVTGHHYAQLLLEQAKRNKELRDILEHARTSLKIQKKKKYLFEQALDYYNIGLARTALGKAEAGISLDQAVATMRRVSRVDMQPAMYLARASYLRTIRNFTAAWADHDAALAIAWRGNMRTYLAECALLAGNLHLDEGRMANTAEQYATAAQLIREDGYGRRLTELHLLHARLLHAQHDPAATQALSEAEARIREVGQWFFWRELQAVAKEIGAPDPGKCQ